MKKIKNSYRPPSQKHKPVRTQGFFGEFNIHRDGLRKQADDLEKYRETKPALYRFLRRELLRADIRLTEK